MINIFKSSSYCSPYLSFLCYLCDHTWLFCCRNRGRLPWVSWMYGLQWNISCKRMNLEATTKQANSDCKQNKTKTSEGGSVSQASRLCRRDLVKSRLPFRWLSCIRENGGTLRTSETPQKHEVRALCVCLHLCALGWWWRGGVGTG